MTPLEIFTFALTLKYCIEEGYLQDIDPASREREITACIQAAAQRLLMYFSALFISVTWAIFRARQGNIVKL